MMTAAIYTDPFHPHLVMHRVEGGAFMMGGDDYEATETEKPVHKVTIPTFYIGKFQVTQSLWQSVMGNDSSRPKVNDRPVNMVSWRQVVNEFLPKLSKLTGMSYRLPSEAEWEFATRGGIQTAGYIYSGSDKLKQVGWYDKNSGNEMHAVGKRMANELGLYDMSGNVWEWCEDHFHGNYKDAPDNGTAWLSNDRGAHRVVRGGDFSHGSRYCRTTYRRSYAPDTNFSGLSFRLALSPQ